MSLLEFAWKGISVTIIKHINLWNKEISSGVTCYRGYILLTEGCVGSFLSALRTQVRKGGIQACTSG